MKAIIKPKNDALARIAFPVKKNKRNNLTLDVYTKKCLPRIFQISERKYLYFPYLNGRHNMYGVT
jgi:hypothetical protein